MKYKIIEISPVSGALGAEVSGVDLSEPVTKQSIDRNQISLAGTSSALF